MVRIKSVGRLSGVMVILILLLFAYFIVQNTQSAFHAQAQGPPTIALGVTSIREGDDFATRVLGLRWNMEGEPYPDIPTTFTNFDRSSFSSSGETWTIDGGVDPNIWMLSPGIIDTQQVLKIGDRFPIDADRYHLLSVRMCSDTADWAAIYWYLDQFGEIPLRIGYWDPPLPIVAGCGVYVFDLANVANQKNYAWTGFLPGLRFDPVNINSPTEIEIDWVRLTTADTSNVVPINWSDVSSGTNLHFFVNNFCSTVDAIPIGVVPRGGVDNGTFNWGAALLPNGGAGTPYPLPESVEPGAWTVLLQVDGVGAPLCANQQLQIREAPILTFHKPSMQSGTDYATEIVGDSWGMSNAGDILLDNDIISSSFSGGQWDALTNADGDPWIHLNAPSSVDASTYKYATMRMWLDADPPGDQQFVSVQRWIWWYVGPAVDAVATEDMLMRTGWQTYSIDLSQALIDPSSPPGSSWSGAPTVFRLDMHEDYRSIDVHLDYILLTAEEMVSEGTPFPIVFEVESDVSTSVTFYYDPDTNPINGRTLMQEYSPSLSYDPNLLFMPIMERNYRLPEILAPYDDSWVWDTTGVPLGSYYVCAVVTDGLNTTTWYSEVMVTVTS